MASIMSADRIAAYRERLLSGEAVEPVFLLELLDSHERLRLTLDAAAMGITLTEWVTTPQRPQRHSAT